MPANSYPYILLHVPSTEAGARPWKKRPHTRPRFSRQALHEAKPCAHDKGHTYSKNQPHADNPTRKA